MSAHPEIPALVTGEVSEESRRRVDDAIHSAMLYSKCMVLNWKPEVRHDLHTNYHAANAYLFAHISTIEKALEEAVKDSRRLDWLGAEDRRVFQSLQWLGVEPVTAWHVGGTVSTPNTSAPTLREAIDAAVETGKTK